ncbi:unnamed protein product [Paramecium pentaurelia]|uniref:RING-type E3 ubiquitin transferase n=1 Tax=Paramecium pentaurelia TaxID=43138 RepID=A0A8S1XI97_9CILI|nr:unnamed protein product [Paramecium pentaurelia]CAD8200264.1 unnamed protein product [Paramecium pentaurelia]CAD8200266.1 unnamed protein product [Paramecium pentaurelia]
MGKQKINENLISQETSSRTQKNIRKQEIKEQDDVINILQNPELNCSICYSSIVDQGIVQNCQHVFCFQCIKQWSKQNLTCPQCRADFTKVIRIWKKSQLAKQKTYTFKQPKQSNEVSNSIFLIQQLSQLLLLLLDIDLENQIDSENEIN